MISILRADKTDTESENERRMLLKDGDAVLGSVCYAVQEDKATLLSLEAPLPILQDGLLRAALNEACHDGVVTAVCRNKALFALLETEGFSKKGDVYSVHLTEFFSRPCKGRGH